MINKTKTNDKKMTTLEVGKRVAQTDLTDCILYAFGAESIEDKVLAGMWKDAHTAIEKVDDYLKGKLGDDYEWGEFEVVK